MVIRIGGNRQNLLKTYDTVEAVGVLDSPWAMPDETGRIVYLCRDRKPPLDAAWDSFKHYD